MRKGCGAIGFGLLWLVGGCGNQAQTRARIDTTGSPSPGQGGGAGGGSGGAAAQQPGGGGAPGTQPTSPAPKSCPQVPAAGASWTEIPPPAVPAGFAVTDAWAAGPDDFFFVGSDPSPDNGVTASTRREVVRWDQGCWSVELAVDGGFSSPQISGTAPDDVWVTVSDAIYHRDANGWSPLDASLASGIAPAPGNVLVLTDVQARTRDDVWFTDQRTILHLLNGQWIKQQLSAGPPGESGSITYFFNRISIVGANDVWIGGGSDQIGNTMDPASLYHFDGQAWTIHEVGQFNVDALWPLGTTPDAFWVSLPPAAGRPLAIHRFEADQVTVPDVAGFAPATDVTSLWGRAANDVWAAGGDIAHFDGISWSRVADAPDAVRDPNHLSQESVVIGDANATWLVGVGPHFFRKAAGANP